MQKTNAAVFGLGPFQVYGVKKLSKKNYNLIGFDKDINPIGKKFVKEFYNLDLKDKNQILNICKRKKIKIFFNFSTDFPLKLISFLNKKLKLKNLNDKAEIISTNKYLFRNIIKKNKINSLFFKKIELDKLKNISLKKKTKYICKPLGLSASKGVFIFQNKKNLIKNIEKHYDYYIDSNKALIEEFVDGDMYSIDGWYFDKKFIPICINKNFKNFYSSLANESILINFKNIRIFNLAKQLTEKICKAIDLKFAPIHFEFIIQKKTKKIFPVEIGLRGAGTYLYGTYFSRIIKKNTADLEIALKENKKIPIIKNNSNKQIFIHFIYAKKAMIFRGLNQKLLKEKLKLPFKIILLKEKNSKIVLSNSANDRLAIIEFEFIDHDHFKKFYFRINKIMKNNIFTI